jgi:hypothetical protein
LINLSVQSKTVKREEEPHRNVMSVKKGTELLVSDFACPRGVHLKKLLFESFDHSIVKELMDLSTTRITRARERGQEGERERGQEGEGRDSYPIMICWWKIKSNLVRHAPPLLLWF